jgi:5-methylcytosine-specific restriction endonuclease McrA
MKPRRNPTDRVSPELRDAVLKKYGYRCVRCGNSQRLQINHKVKRSKFGAKRLAEKHDITNLEVLCAPCHQIRDEYVVEQRINQGGG